MNLRLAQTTMAFVAMASLVPSAKAADKRFMSTPRDTHIYSRPATPKISDLYPLQKRLRRRRLSPVCWWSTQ
jgi:hypothetical protein